MKARCFDPKGAGPKKGLYSHVGAAEGGTTLYIAGQLSFNKNDEFVGEGDFRAQFRQVFANLGDVLKGCGLDFTDVLKFTTYMTSDAYIPLFMEERQKFFPELFGRNVNYPPNTLLMISRLVHPGCMIEVEAIAHSPRPLQGA